MAYVLDADYNRGLALEETIRRGLGNLGIVDGRDIGSEEMNFLIRGAAKPRPSVRGYGAALTS